MIVKTHIPSLSFPLERKGELGYDCVVFHCGRISET
jgi:hypothetical protein